MTKLDFTALSMVSGGGYGGGTTTTTQASNGGIAITGNGNTVNAYNSTSQSSNSGSAKKS